MRSRPAIGRLGLFLVIVGALVLLPATATAQAPCASNTNSVLVLIEGDGDSRYSAAAAADGFTVVMVDTANWNLTPTSVFQSYRALIIGDGNPPCDQIPPAVTPAYSAAVDGPVLIIGTDEALHFGQGGSFLIDDGVAFAASGTAPSSACNSDGETGAYISLGCDYHFAPPSTPVPLLAGFGAFTAEGSSCHDDVHVVATHPAFSTSDDTTLSNWGCSTHNFFNSFPGTFLPLAIAEGVMGAGSMCFMDSNGADPTYPDCTTVCGAGNTCGIPYVLARGVTPAGCGNGTVEPPEQCDDGNTISGDGCSSSCMLEGVPAVSFGMLALLAVLLLGGLGWVTMRRLHG